MFLNQTVRIVLNNTRIIWPQNIEFQVISLLRKASKQTPNRTRQDITALIGDASQQWKTCMQALVSDR